MKVKEFLSCSFVFASLAWGAQASVLRELPREVNGRQIDLFWQNGGQDLGNGGSDRNLVIVQHPVPKADGKGRPLYVVLHSAGHDALSALDCTRTPHNHDIYHSPDDFFALYVDCRAYLGADWWWGAQNKKDTAETSCEKRVVETVKQVIARYGCDANRVYISGCSMGGSGALGIGLRHGEIFAAVKANVPAIAQADHPFKALGLPPYGCPPSLKIPDPPPVIDYSAQNDKWSDTHERLIPAMRDRRYAWAFYWADFGHANNDLKMAEKNDIIHSLDWLSISRNQPYPVFMNASSDDTPPWLGDRADPRPGQINGFFRWTDAKAEVNGVQMALFLDGKLKSKFFTVPQTATVDVTIRRLGAFKIQSDDIIAWTFGDQKGTVPVDGEGLFTIKSLTVSQAAQVLSCRLADSH